MDKYKGFLPYSISLILMFFSFLFLSIPFFNIGRIALNGYSVLSLWEFGWSGILLSVLQLLELLLMITIILLAIAGLFLELINLLTTKSRLQFNRPNKILVLINLFMDAIILIFLIVFVNINSFTLSAGLFMKIFFDLAGLIVLLVIEYNFNNRAKEIFKPIVEETKETNDIESLDNDW